MRIPKTNGKRAVAKKVSKAGKPYKPLPVEMAEGFGQLGLTQGIARARQRLLKAYA
jgi:hypothetical protein